MNKQDILNLEGTMIEEEQLMKIEESEFVTEVQSCGYSGQYPDYIDYIEYTVTLDGGEEIKIYSYF